MAYIANPRYMAWEPNALYLTGYDVIAGMVNKIDFTEPSNLKHTYGKLSTKLPIASPGRSIALYRNQYLAVTYNTDKMTFHDKTTGFDVSDALVDADFVDLVNLE